MSDRPDMRPLLNAHATGEAIRLAKDYEDSLRKAQEAMGMDPEAIRERVRGLLPFVHLMMESRAELDAEDDK